MWIDKFSCYNFNIIYISINNNKLIRRFHLVFNFSTEWRRQNVHLQEEKIYKIDLPCIIYNSGPSLCIKASKLYSDYTKLSRFCFWLCLSLKSAQLDSCLPLDTKWDKFPSINTESANHCRRLVHIIYYFVLSGHSAAGQVFNGYWLLCLEHFINST